MDYRGYGNSEGVPTEKGLVYDAESVLAHLLERNDINHNKIYLFGRSLGGAVAIDLAYRCCTRKLVSLSNDQVLVNDKKEMGHGQAASSSTNENNTQPKRSTSLSVSSADDELAHLNSNTQLCAKDRKLFIAGLIVENTFTSILDMVFVIIDEFLKSRQSNQEHHGHQPVSTRDDDEEDDDNDDDDVTNTYGGGKLAKFLKCLRFFLRYFITNNWNSAVKVKDIVMPTLYLSGQSDELIPPKQMSKLFAFAKTKCVLPVMQTYEEGDHNSTWQRAGQQYWDDIMAFITTTSFVCPQHQT
eukprot:CAMPEP_0202694020 /NCGR_PEP_ID=MMETSP1385-20130828/7993_1 /ASSEMBLY_ACC=CAM_ASM_000861 /TAXON_ID=933848 /ORGANISM="Elphidium margaritaceum" /LENGTH=298 /DNA_ID=CAMNT_0049349797 /DNA_START=331 /DNA_END=1227 /DNA_ORIENTATION=-